jgi:hypothetical protein
MIPPVRPLATISALAAFDRRGPGTDAERRAARWLAGELIGQRLRVRLEAFWCRPNWALAHAWHVALALAGSLLSVAAPTVGIALLGVALISIAMDALTGISPGRRLSHERASQNVVARPAAEKPERHAGTTSLIIAANYDAGRTALIYRDPFRRAAASLRRLSGPFALGWLGWLSLAITWLLAVAVVRTTEHHAPKLLGAIQLPPTVALVLGLALLLEAAGAGYGPAAGDNASGAAVAIALARTLTAAPPRNLTIALVLTGAGEGHEIGLRRYLRAHRHRLMRANTIVLGVASCGAGQPRWWRSDGRLIPIACTRRLRDLATAVADAHPHLGVQPHPGRGGTPTLPARLRRLPSITIGSLDPGGLAPRSHQRSDTADLVGPAALDRTVQFGLLLIDAIDRALGPVPQPEEMTTVRPA